MIVALVDVASDNTIKCCTVKSNFWTVPNIFFYLDFNKKMSESEVVQKRIVEPPYTTGLPFLTDLPRTIFPFLDDLDLLNPDSDPINPEITNFGGRLDQGSSGGGFLGGDYSDGGGFSGGGDIIG